MRAEKQDASASTRWMTGLTVAVLLLILAGRIIAVASGADPWVDEAMLIRNLPAGSLLAPLPLYHQAAPLGYLAMASGVASLGHTITSLRILSALISLAGLAALYQALKWLGLVRAIPLALALAGMSRLGLMYSVEIKQYGMEAAAAAISCAAGILATRHPSLKSSLVLCGALIITVLGAFTAPIVVTAVFFGMLAQKRTLSGLVSWAWPFAVGTLAFAAQYVLYDKPMTFYQFAAYRDLYELGFGRSGWLRVPALLLAFYTPSVISPLHFLVPSGLFWVGAIVLAWRADHFFPAALTAAIVSTAALNVAHLLPTLEPRHFVFLLPLTSAVLALAAAEACDLLHVPRRNVLLGALGVAVAFTGLYFARHTAKEQVSPLLAAYHREEKNEPLWVFPMAQPVADVLGEKQFLGRLTDRSGLQDWLLPVYRREMHGTDVQFRLVSGYPASVAADLTPRPSVWMLFGIPEGDAIAKIIAAMQDKGFHCVARANDVSTALFRCAR